MIDAFDLDDVRAGAAQVGAHRDQEFREILHLGLARRVLDGGFAGRQHRRHHDVLGRAHRRIIEPDARALKLVGMRFDVAVAQLNCARRAREFR